MMGLRSRKSRTSLPPKGVELWEWAQDGKVEVFRRSKSPRSGKLGPHMFEDPAKESKQRQDSGSLLFEGIPEERQSKYPLDGDVEECGFTKPQGKLLGEWLATSIAGNDITSSVLYSGGLVIGQSGYLAVVGFFLVAIVLNAFRGIYEEVITALPLNGASYSAMMNVSPKRYACVAACLSILSYMATVVTSGASAMHYLQGGLWGDLNVEVGTIVVFVIFCGLMLVGVKESSYVAFVIFVIHLITLTILLIMSIVYGVETKFVNMVDNFHAALPNPTFSALVFGYSQAMLGVTGFETSANFVEEQKPGVFRKTLFNMWIFASFFNISLSLMAFAVIPVSDMYSSPGVVSNEVQNFLLGVMANEIMAKSSTKWLSILVTVDAVLVLAAAVLTGYVGVTGLIQRMISDDCLPHFLDAKIKCNEANFPIPILFCAICISLYVMTGGSVDSISGVYVVAFLSVMVVFATTNLVMKHTRSGLKRDKRVHWAVVLACIAAVLIALGGNIAKQVEILGYFAIYFVSFLLVILLMYGRAFLLRATIHLTELKAKRSSNWSRFRNWLIDMLLAIEKKPICFLSKTLDIRDLNKAVLYMRHNELTRSIKIVHGFAPSQDGPISSDEFNRNLIVLRKEYPTVRIDIVALEAPFCPGFIRLVEAFLEIPPHRMMISSPSNAMRFNVAELGGVRIIMSGHDRGLQGEVVPILKTLKSEPAQVAGDSIV